jgi:hypothetical protein
MYVVSLSYILCHKSVVHFRYTCMTYNSHDTNCDAPDAHVDNLCLFSDAQTEKKEIRDIKDFFFR